MCRRVVCSKCSRPGYSGCGAHVEQVLAGVPREDRCRCREEKAESAGTGSGRSWLRDLFGK